MDMPQTTIGVLGSGQLGRMLVIAAAQLGIKTHVFAPDAAGSPAGELAHATTTAAYDDYDALSVFGASVDAVTSEFENVPSDTMAHLATLCPVSPGTAALHIAQHRIREKSFAREHGINTPDFWHITDSDSLVKAMAELNGRGVLKTCQLGYDGKGQLWVDPQDDLAASFAALGSNDVILEAAVTFRAEASFLVARAADGRIAHFPPSLNTHKDGILARSIGPANLPEALVAKGQKAVQDLADAMGLVGLLALETFVTNDDQLLFNEIAPRPHNSFHWTIEGCATSQFTQLARCLAGMPLASTHSYGTWQMDNLLGEDMTNIEALAAEAGLHLHLYGKTAAKTGRKMGHTNRQITTN
jgi:5-(carboxyamino)imidazole ribonucleotide synthase